MHHELIMMLNVLLINFLMHLDLIVVVEQEEEKKKIYLLYDEEEDEFHLLMNFQ